MLLLACGLATACSTYQPLDRGSDVPWANPALTGRSPQAAAISEPRGAARATAVMVAGTGIGCGPATG